MRPSTMAPTDMCMAVCDWFFPCQEAFTDAYCRLVAMKLFSERAVITCAWPPRRSRYLLYNPMVKMKWHPGGRGDQPGCGMWSPGQRFEKEPFFDKSPPMRSGCFPSLKARFMSIWRLLVKFMQNYFFNSKAFAKVRAETMHQWWCLFHQGPTKGLGKVQFSQTTG